MLNIEAATDICILACETLKDELSLVMKNLNRALPVFWVDSGNLRLIAALLSGDWNTDEFLVVEPGKEISFEDSLNVGRTQQAV
jgi:hypothetical protein